MPVPSKKKDLTLAVEIGRTGTVATRDMLHFNLFGGYLLNLRLYG